MKVNWKIVSGVCTLVLVYDGVAGLHNMRLVKRLRIIAEKEQARADYLADLLDKHGVQVTEFDQIVLKTIAEMP